MAMVENRIPPPTPNCSFPPSLSLAGSDLLSENCFGSTVKWGKKGKGSQPDGAVVAVAAVAGTSDASCVPLLSSRNRAYVTFRLFLGLSGIFRGKFPPGVLLKASSQQQGRGIKGMG